MDTSITGSWPAGPPTSPAGFSFSGYTSTTAERRPALATAVARAVAYGCYASLAKGGRRPANRGYFAGRAVLATSCRITRLSLARLINGSWPKRS